MCRTSGTHIIDGDTKIIDQNPAFLLCRVCGEPSWILATVKRRLDCEWVSHSKCGKCYE